MFSVLSTRYLPVSSYSLTGEAYLKTVLITVNHVLKNVYSYVLVHKSMRLFIFSNFFDAFFDSGHHTEAKYFLIKSKQENSLVEHPNPVSF